MLTRAKHWAITIRRDVRALYLATRDPRVPWYAKFVAVCVAAYALSPIDLIPDFVPVLGYLDDLVILPLGILLAIKLIPPDIMAELRAQAVSAPERPRSRSGAAAIIAIWATLAVLTTWLVARYAF
jgi:uncharacterized membrane protein YkvA (DUF1232 family)